jgi:hypothetical protein
MTDPLARRLCEAFPEVMRASSAAEVVDRNIDGAPVVFLDSTAIAELDRAAQHRGCDVGELELPGPTIAMTEGPLASAMAWLPARPWLCHVMTSSMLEHPIGRHHLEYVVVTLASGNRARLLDWVGPELVGRRVGLTRASERVDRQDRMAEFFASKRVGRRTVEGLRQICDRLVTNAFYEAPFAAGAVSHPIARELDIALPADNPCELVYGVTDELAVLRVRDPFGSLSRTRIISHHSWSHITSAAMIVAISVVAHHHTDVLVAVSTRDDHQPRPFAFHLLFKDSTKRRFWNLEDSSATPTATATFVSSVSSAGDP